MACMSQHRSRVRLSIESFAAAVIGDVYPRPDDRFHVSAGLGTAIAVG